MIKRCGKMISRILVFFILIQLTAAVVFGMNEEPAEGPGPHVAPAPASRCFHAFFSAKPRVKQGASHAERMGTAARSASWSQAGQNGQDETGDVPNASGNLNIEASVDPVGLKEGYSAVLYDSLNGLPTSEANAIAQTEEGFIWIGSYSGLIRYDGDTFERMDSSTGISSVKCLYVDRDNRLWIGTNESGVFLMERGEFRRWDDRNGLKSTSIRSILQRDDGVVFIATTNGIATVDPEMNFRLLDDLELADPFVHELRTSADGSVYGLDNSGNVFLMKNDDTVQYLSFKDRQTGGVNCILPDPENTENIYLATGDSSIYYCRIGESLEVLKKTDISPLSQIQQFEYIDGGIWICTRNGIGVMDPDGFHKLDNIPMDNSIEHVMTDYEGNLWFSSTRQGVMKIVPNQFSNIFERYRLEEAVVNSTCMYDGRLFIATDTGLIVLDREKVVSEIPLTRAETVSGTDLNADDLIGLLKGCRIRSVIRDSKDRLWISSWRSHGLLLYDRGELTAFTAEDGLFSNQVRAVYECGDGSILAAVTGGVNVIRDGRVAAGYSEEDGIVNTEILTVAEARNGDILIGTDGGGIFVLNEEGTRHIGRAEGLTSEAVMRIKPDRESELYWIVTGNSIAVMDGNYQLTTLNNFPYSNNFDLYENSKGEFWILSSNGIYVSRREELLENGAMAPLHYSRSDGIPCITTANSYSELTGDGDLYISGTTGVAKVNIENPFENVSRLKIAVPYIDADGVRIYPDAEGGFTVPSKVRKLTVYSYVFNYSLTSPLVSYHLEGFDQTENTVSRSDLGPVDYTNLSGGTYRFVIRLSDSMGRGNRTFSVQIIKEKALYENVWFIVLTGFLAVLLVAHVVSLYFRRKLAALEKKHREEEEKQRISSELRMAAELQESVLPHNFPPFPDRGEFDIFASMVPAREIGGDFYDFFLIDDDHLCLTIADVSGKGIPAALFMMISKAILENSAMLGKSPSVILTKTNEALCSNNQLEMFVTVWLGILEISTGIIHAANAGHEYPAVMKDGEFTLLKDRHGLVIGAMEGIKYTEYEIRLKPGDKLFVYTDGVTEATDSGDRLFGVERLVKALNRKPSAAPQKILENVRADVDGFVRDAEQFDDLTMLCLEYRGSVSDTVGDAVNNTVDDTDNDTDG